MIVEGRRKPGTNYFDSIAQFKYSTKNANVYRYNVQGNKTNFITSNFKSIYILLF